jgi:hypothetical protein
MRAMRRLAAALVASLLLPRAALAGAAPLDVRLEAISRQLLGVPYQLGPLGEEAPPDVDPRFRLDAFDCTTYVETVLALSLAGADAASGDDEREQAARRWLDSIRYSNATPSFESRRHLIDAQWIPELVASGLLRDVTREIGGGATRTASIRLRRDVWERSSLARDLGLAWSAVPPGPHPLPYLPWRLLERDDVRAALPKAAVLSLIASADADVPTLVSHQALLLRVENGLLVRHATSRRGSVIEEPLELFLSRSHGRRSRPVLGINVLAIVDRAGGADAVTAD